MDDRIVSTAVLTLSRQQEEFLARYRTHEAQKAYFESYGLGVTPFFRGGGGSHGVIPPSPEPELPYDSMVEYLEFTGIQYIDLGIFGSLDIGADISFSFSNQSSNCFVFGCRQNYISNAFYVTIGINSETIVVGFGSDTANNFTYHTSDYNSIYRVLSNKKERVLYKSSEEVMSNLLNVEKKFTTPHPLFIGRSDPNDGQGTVVNNFVGRFYSVKLYLDDVIILDLIPVRLGNIGFMYDKIFGALYGNSGAGDFILGSDL